MTIPLLPPAQCEICGEPVMPSQTLAPDSDISVSCSDFNCQRLLSQKSSLNSQLFAAQSAFHSQRIKAQRAKEAARKQHIEHIETTEARENQRILESMRDQHTELAHAPLHLVPIPYGISAMRPMTRQRVKNYTQHLREIIQHGFLKPKHIDTDSSQDTCQSQKLIVNTQLQSISDSLCTLCKGGCCASGADSAYLSADTIRRLIDIEPLSTEHSILDAYLDKLPTASIDGACINQTASGCALPRDMRSDTCNDYYCDPLSNYRESMHDKAIPDRILAIQRSHAQGRRFDSENGNKILCVALLDDKGVKQPGMNVHPGQATPDN